VRYQIQFVYLLLQLLNRKRTTLAESMLYDPYAYWNKLIAGDMDLSLVGHPGLGMYNHVAYRFRLAAFKRALAGLLPHWPDVRLFEAGFGIGFYLRYYAQIGVTQVTGIDLSAAAVTYAQKLFPKYKLFQHDLSEPLALPSGSFDLVTAIDVLYHIIDDHRWYLALSNACSLLKPGGVLILTDKFPANGAWKQFHVRRRSLDTYNAHLQGHGMVVERILPVFVFMDEPILKRSPEWLGPLLFTQWRILNKMIRLLGAWPKLRDLFALNIAGIQYPFEKAALAIFRRSPNLEMLVARKELG
jgi:SAM-dependent methyltransferase